MVRVKARVRFYLQTRAWAWYCHRTKTGIRIFHKARACNRDRTRFWVYLKARAKFMVKA